MIFEKVLRATPKGTVIPKPAAKGDFIVYGIGKRRGETAVIYSIPNHKNPVKPYKKGITSSEFETAHKQLLREGSFTRKWFKENMPACNSEGGCNFTTIGGILILLGETEYAGSGEYGITN